MGSKEKSRRRNRRYRGGGLPSLNPAPLNGTNIELTKPSVLLNRSNPYVPYRYLPTPMPAFLSGGPALGPRIPGPPLLKGGRKRKTRKHLKHLKKSKRRRTRHQRGGK